MALLTLIARSSDGLLLSASIVDDESGRSFGEYQTKAKHIFKMLTAQSPQKCSINCDPLVFHYLLEEGICYLALCEQHYPPKLAYGYLENLHSEFSQQHGHEVHRAQRPYHFIEFGAEIDRVRKNYKEGQSRRSGSKLQGLSDELQGVHKIMFENIDAVLQRGELLTVLGEKAGRLAYHSQAYKKEAHYLNLRSSWAARIAVAVAIFLLLIFLRYWLF